MKSNEIDPNISPEDKPKGEESSKLFNLESKWIKSKLT